MKELLKQTYGSFFEDKLIEEIVETSLLRDFKEG